MEKKENLVSQFKKSEKKDINLGCGGVFLFFTGLLYSVISGDWWIFIGSIFVIISAIKINSVHSKKFKVLIPIWPEENFIKKYIEDLQKVTDTSVLEYIAMNQRYSGKSRNMLESQQTAYMDSIRSIARCRYIEIRKKEIEKIDDQDILAKIIKKEEWGEVREFTVKKLTDQAVLTDIAKYDSDKDVRKAAVEQITDQAMLVDVADFAKLSSNGNIRGFAKGLDNKKYFFFFSRLLPPKIPKRCARCNSDSEPLSNNLSVRNFKKIELYKDFLGARENWLGDKISTYQYESRPGFSIILSLCPNCEEIERIKRKEAWKLWERKSLPDEGFETVNCHCSYNHASGFLMYDELEWRFLNEGYAKEFASINQDIAEPHRIVEDCRFTLESRMNAVEQIESFRSLWGRCSIVFKRYSCFDRENSVGHIDDESNNKKIKEFIIENMFKVLAKMSDEKELTDIVKNSIVDECFREAAKKRLKELKGGDR